ncbi:MAG TPA: helix-turn-helix domain-containing protein [Chloroflexota bacterium]|nr:helix-turn-helix domain-containing protein [Chloroflexota bacterium]
MHTTAGSSSCPFGEALRRYREAAGLSQEALAERAGLTAQAIGALERGERRHPFPSTVRALAEALQLSDEARLALLAAVPRRGRAMIRESNRATTGPITAAPDPISIPCPLTPLLGREGDIAAVTDLLGTTRLLTLTGPGGVGKTRLALHIASTGRPIANAVFVSLAPLNDPQLVLPTIARTLGVSHNGGEPILDVLRRALHDQHVLILLDNCEHVLSAANSVAALLAACQDLTILATSRSPLGIRGEQEYPVDPLRLPPASHEVTPYQAREVAAVRLFVERARAASPGFHLTAENVSAVVAICRRLDGLPLALELAAPRIKTLPPPALLGRLSSRLALLTGGPADLPARQQTLRSAIDWSYSLLSAEERTLFGRLSVFAGGCTLDDAEAVCGRGGLNVLDGLTSLVDKSLLRQGASDVPTFAMLETVREFATEKLAETGEVETIHATHAEHFMRLAQEGGNGLRGPREAEWRARLEGTMDNLRTALRFLLDRGAAADELRLASALGRFWNAQGYWREGEYWLEAGLAAEAGDTALRAPALLVLGSLLINRGELGRATAALERATELFRELGEVRATVETLSYLALVAYWQADYTLASRRLEESEPLSRALDDRGLYAGRLGMLGAIAMERGDLEGARVRLEEAVAEARTRGEPDRLALELSLLGRLAYHEGNLAEAERDCGEAVMLAEPLGVRRSLAYSLLVLGLAATARGQLDRARHHLAESLQLSRDLGYLYTTLNGLTGRAAIAVATGQAERAARLKGAEAALRAKLGIPLPPSLRSEDEGTTARTRKALVAERFAAAWGHGQMMSLEEAVECALEESALEIASGIR